MQPAALSVLFGRQRLVESWHNTVNFLGRYRMNDDQKTAVVNESISNGDADR